jgi:hypothetical protein
MSGALLAGRHCGTCGATVFARHMELSRRTQRVGADPATGKPGKVIHVLAAEVLLDFCDAACWQHQEPQVAQVFGLKATWPPFHMHASCCACGRPVDRSLPHVTLNVYDIEDTSKPWLSSARMHEDREFAVLCATCAPPAVAQDATARVQPEAREGTEEAQVG